MKKLKIQFNFRIDEDLFKRMDKAVDGMRYRSRGHFIEIAVLELLERLKPPKKARKT